MNSRGLAPRSRADHRALLETTAEAAFISDGGGRITVWNDAAAALLGRAASGVVGRKCCEVIRGRDDYGNLFCNDSCAIRKMRRHREPIHPFMLMVPTSSGGALKVACSVIVTPGKDARHDCIIHLMQPVSAFPAPVAGSGGRGEPLAPVLTGCAGDHGAAPAGRPLSPREIEVLRLLAGGTSTTDIASALGISSSTVNNHIQHALDKLEVHNRLQAVLIVRRDGLI